MIQLPQILNIKNSAITRGYDLKDHGSWPFIGISNDSGVEVNEKRALMHTGVFRSVTLLGGALATSPKHLLRRTEVNGKRQREVASDHPAHWLIYRKPNRAQNTYQYHFLAATHLLLWGNFYAYIRRDRFYDVTSITPIMPWMVEPHLKNNRKYFQIGGNTYTDNEILHVYGLSWDGVKGVSPIRYASESLGIGLAAQKMEATSFGKGMHAGGVIELDEEFSAAMMGSTDEEAQEDFGEFRKNLRQTYQSGPDSWHQMLMLPQGMKYTQFKMAFEIEKLVANKKFTLADIARIFGVPLHKLMELDRSTNNNIEHQGIEYVTDGVMPITMNFTAEYDNKLLKESEKENHYFNINLDGQMRADIKSRFEAYSIMLGKNAPGWAEPSEVRDLEDMDEGDPDNWFVPSNMNEQNMVNAE